MRVRKILFEMARDIAGRDALKDYDLAFMLGTSRTRASNLLHGHIAKFNSETLIDVLARLGVTIEPTVIRVVPYRKRRPPQRVPSDWVCE
jgi:predicted XRE-type DNA-binding protein